MSAYRHFTSKDDLVAAALERYNPRHIQWLAGGGEHRAVGAGSAGGVAGASDMADSGGEVGVVGSGGVAVVAAAVGIAGMGSVAGASDVADSGGAVGVAGSGGVGGAVGVVGSHGAGGVAGSGGAGGVGEEAGHGAAESARRILSAFDRLESAAGGENFRGCPFVDAALAASAPDRRIAAIAGRHKQDLIGALAGLAARARLDEPEEVGAAVALVIDGAAAQAAVAHDPAARQRIVRRGRRIAEMLLATAGQP